MKIPIIFPTLLIVSLLFCSTSFVLALSTNEKGSILDSFKDQQYELLFENDIGIVDGGENDIFNISRKLNIFENIQGSISSEVDKLENKNTNIMNRVFSLETSLGDIDKAIEKTEHLVHKVNASVIDTKKEINSSEITIDLLNKKITENRKILLNYLIYIYKKSNNIYGDEDVDNIKSILLNNGDISGIINDLYFKGIIEVTGKKLIDKHRGYISELYMKKLDLEEKQSNFKSLRKTLVIEKKVLHDKKEFKVKVLSISKGKQALYEKYISDKIEVEKNVRLKLFKEKVKFNSVKKNLLQNYGCSFVDLSKSDINPDLLSGECLNLNKVIYAESKLKGFGGNGEDQFDWPVSPAMGLSTYYKDNEYTDLFGSEHEAIDVIAMQGTAIEAPADGYVLYVEPPESDGYAYLALKHADGYVTVYGHISNTYVKVYDYIKKGDVIAATGGEFGANGSGIMTTGPHLHFEVFQDKVSIDPLKMFNISNIPHSNIPDNYKYQFYQDFKDKKGYEFKGRTKNGRTFKLEGRTEAERQKNLIDVYAVGVFRNLNLWIEESLDGNIDPTFVMCVGLAETGLGKHVKTPFNVGNVGNTDSGSTKTFPNARSGIYWMIRTFNNKYLSQYDSIKDLSRFGNHDLKKPIYASSPDNWHNNIIRCMSTIKGVYVPDDYNFRLFK